MKSNPADIDRTRGQVMDGASTAMQQRSAPDAPASAATQGRFRRLKWNELVSAGDFVMTDKRRLEPWEGPNGFRADAFVKAIYRRH